MCTKVKVCEVQILKKMWNTLCQLELGGGFATPVLSLQ